MASAALPDFVQMDRDYERHALEIGKVVLIWNTLHQTLARLFWVVSGIDNGMISEAIWQSMTSDRGQRLMLSDVVKAAFEGKTDAADQRVFREINWLLCQVEKLSEPRNNVVHVPLVFVRAGEKTTFESAHHLGHKRAVKLKGKRLLVEYAWCEQCCANLNSFASRLTGHLAWPRTAQAEGLKQAPFPKQPQMPSRDEIARQLADEVPS